MSVPVTMTQSGKQINVSVAASSKGPAAMHGEVWICSISKAVPISIGRGENRGRQVTYHNVVRNLLKVGDWNGTAGQLDGAAGEYFPRGRRWRGGLCPGRQSRQARRDARRGLHVAALTPLPSVFGARTRADRSSAGVDSRDRGATDVRRTRRDRSSVAAPERQPSKISVPNKKGPTFVGPVWGLTQLRNRPDPDDPGGLGAEESGTERTGPTQDCLVAIQQGGRWAEVGRYYDSANDPVTAMILAIGVSGRRSGRARISTRPPRPSCSRAPLAQSCRLR